MKPGETFQLRLTPDAGLTRRYADVSGDHNPIHIDDDVAREMGLPGRILHGLWTMSQVARLHTELAGEPLALQRLQVEFRGAALPGEEIEVIASVRAVEGRVAVIDCEARQNGRRVIRNGVAEVALR